MQDLKPKTYSLSQEHEGTLQSLRIHLPDKIQLYEVAIATAAWQNSEFYTHLMSCEIDLRPDCA